MVCFGCSKQKTNEIIMVQPTMEPSLTSKPTNTAQPTFTIIPTRDLSTSTITPINTMRPTPKLTLTLHPEDIMATLDAFSSDVSNCRLPCWFGIIPGKTDFDEAFRILASLGKHKWVYYPGDFPSANIDEDFETHTFITPSKKKYEGRAELTHYVSIVNDLVAKIETEAFLSLPQALEELGMPTNIWVRLNISLGEDGPPPFPFGIGLYYEEENIGIEYFVINGTPVGEKIQACISDTAVILIGTNEIPITYDSFNLINGYETQPTLKEALGLSIETFYENYKDAKTDICFQTPYDIWSSPVYNR